VKRIVISVVLAVSVLCAVGLWSTRPQHLPADVLAGDTANIADGNVIFAEMGCASCHMAPDSKERTRLAGGKSFTTNFGTFYAPNISTDPVHGVGNWSDLDLANAIMKGTSPDNRHYYPVFPYGSYGRADLQDVMDLIAYLRTLEPDPTPSLAHDVTFPFNIRATLGGWKMLFVKSDWVVQGNLSTEQARGRILVEALGHCGECHTPRNALGGLNQDAWLAGAVTPGGDGRTPDLRADNLKWSAPDIVAYLKTGLTPDYDSAGGEMVDVISNTSQLPQSDLEAIAAYLLMVNVN
jgi:mono/diheme cytochrome c family protein